MYVCMYIYIHTYICIHVSVLSSTRGHPEVGVAGSPGPCRVSNIIMIIIIMIMIMIIIIMMIMIIMIIKWQSHNNIT